jgi:hypothetical protein
MMQIKSVAIWVTVAVALLLAACIPAGPVLGLGPALDPFVGPVLLVALVLGGLWTVKSVVRSPAGQAAERHLSEAGQAIVGHFHSGPDKNSAQHQHESDGAPRSEEILRERYARGEIDRKQYLEMLDDLKNRK